MSNSEGGVSRQKVDRKAILKAALDRIKRADEKLPTQSEKTKEYRSQEHHEAKWTLSAREL